MHLVQSFIPALYSIDTLLLPCIKTTNYVIIQICKQDGSGSYTIVNKYDPDLITYDVETNNQLYIEYDDGPR